MAGLQQPTITTVAYCYNLGDLAVAMSLLHASDIEVMAHSAKTAGIYWNLMHALGGVRLCVPAAQAEEARAILAALAEPRSRRMNLLAAVAVALVYFATGLPPAPRGFYLGPRTVSASSV